MHNDVGTERETNRKNSAGVKCTDLHVPNANKYKFLSVEGVTLSVRLFEKGRLLGTYLKQTFADLI